MKLLDKDNQPYDDKGLQRHINKALQVTQPVQSSQRRSYQIIKRLFNPTLVNADNIPAQPCLFVANHSLFALDGMVMAPVLYEEKGRFVRGLGDRFLWNPKTEDFLLENGGLIGHPLVCAAMMENGSDLMVFPGGAHEATKTTEQKYTLQWKERYGFVRMAAQHGYTIMPVAIVGPDEFYSHWMEGEEIPDSPLGKLLQRFGVIDENTRPDMLPPLPRGTLGSLWPKPQTCYFQFGQPIDLSGLKGKKHSKKQLLAIRAEVAEAIETMLAELLLLREQKRGEESWLRRLLTI